MLSDSARPLREVRIAESLAAAVGPEGDWSPEESARLIAENFSPVRLGARIMRASTAVASFCASLAMMYEKR